MDAATLTAIAAIVAAVAGPLTAWIQGRRTMAKVADVEQKIDGPLTALIASIRAEAEVKIAVAEENTRRAFRDGRERERGSPMATKADVEAGTKTVTDAVAAIPPVPP